MTHKVRQGQHLAGIAHDYGFSEFQPIWQHAQNADLRAKRKTPHILYPGDLVYIPDREERHEAGSTDKCHRFHLKARPLRLRLILERPFYKPFASVSGELQLEQTRPVQTNSEGELDQRIDPSLIDTTLALKLTVQGAGGVTVPSTEGWSMRVGYLDPIDQPTGWLARLANLGYYRGPVADDANPDDVRSAVEEFQCDQSLVVDGVCGPVTQNKLKTVHGC